ncbi:MAG: hypothetical protein AAF902_18330 [Chloroflexota bacterium]
MNLQTRRNSNRYFLGLLLTAFVLVALTVLSFRGTPAQAVVSEANDETGASQMPTTLFLPVMYGSLYPAPTSLASSTAMPAGSDMYTWTLNWDAATTPAGASYTIFESNSPDMDPILNTYTSSTNSLIVNQPASTSNIFYYTVKLTDSQSVESAPIKVVGAYHDNFLTPSGWEIRRQDFDDTENVLSYQFDNLKMHVRGRWDYFIASPLAEAPPPPYRISTLVKFEGAGNLNAYGIIFGGDWNGGQCPSVFPPTRSGLADGVEYDVLPPIGVRAPDAPSVFDNCLNNYYRLQLLWKDGGPRMLAQYKKIDFHDDNNEGRGQTTYIDGTQFTVSSGSANEWNEWSIEVYPDGTILTFSGDERINTVKIDTDYINRPYFGFYASSNEYPGADPLWNYLTVEPIEPMSE